ncbi:Uncharacterized protein Rs2_12086 [Raphanus sativus]|uniref:Uncharacterized protein LOC108847827 n=1 Tax=Raphanus sativus TaxID=3726 RepID=A0A6J0MX14_RAPSA|nr:uncharacterized protein LOC108847827 [Raphanus sativus]KAJ4908428.1 Uncharacterized protein Rs2_12086 [Raphanus sativus]
MSTDLFSEDDVEENPSSSASSSRMELKRIHQWLTQEDSSGSELFSNNKRQVVEIDGGSRLAWDDTLVPNCLFDPATSHLLGRYISPLGHQEEVLHGTSSFNLDTIRKVTVNNHQACESQNMLPDESMVQFYGEGVSRSYETVPSYEANTLSLGQTFSTIDKSFISPEPFASNPDGNFIPNLSYYDKGDENVFSTFHPFDKGVGNFAQSLQKSADENIFMSLLPCHKDNVNVVLSGRQSPFSQGGEMAAFTVPSQEKADKNSDHRTTSQEDTTISPVPVVNSFENFFSHSPADDNMSFQPRYPSYASSALLVHKSKDSKTAKKGSTTSSTNTFPSNVKSLLSTGMFDGVTVKYYSWSREKNLKGVIKGTGYLCGCSDCNLNKVLNAYEFEQHANCKTKHPNNHIYFENGKTIYGVVQELKNTPQEKLFDAIQNVTGSDINYKNFNTWKASYQVASLELQRIYGKDAATLAS